MTNHAIRPTIAEAARTSIQIASLRQGWQFEVSFRCEWDAATQQITTAEPVFRGHERATRFISSQYRVGQLMLHTHPSGAIAPSEADLDAAASAAGYGVGFAICDTGGETLFLVTAPEDVGLYGFPPTPAQTAWYAAIKRWQLKLFGRSIDLTLYPKQSRPTR